MSLKREVLIAAAVVMTAAKTGHDLSWRQPSPDRRHIETGRTVGRISGFIQHARSATSLADFRAPIFVKD